MNKLLLIIAASIISSSSLFAQNSDGDDELVIIRMQIFRKNYTKALESVINITESDGSLRTIDLEQFPKNFLKDNSKSLQLIHGELKDYLSKGFKIISHTKGYNQLALYYEDYVLYKESE